MDDRDLARIADEAFAEASRRAGEWIACRSGCDECCRRPFAITLTDAARLREGLARLPGAAAKEILDRARTCREKFVFDFPGDAATGQLTASEEWREWFFTRHQEVPCPVLDAATGVCLLYDHRPTACRIYGPLIQMGEETSDPCQLCFSGATRDQIEATRVRIELPEGSPAEAWETLVAFALSDRPR